MKKFIYAPIAQLDRALVYGTKGLGFESPWVRQNKKEALASFLFCKRYRGTRTKALRKQSSGLFLAADRSAASLCRARASPPGCAKTKKKLWLLFCFVKDIGGDSNKSVKKTVHEASFLAADRSALPCAAKITDYHKVAILHHEE